KGEEESGGRNNPSLLADSFEAFIGALFLDQGIEAVKVFIDKTVIPQANDFIEKNLLKDPKSKLQEFIQSKKQSSPIYKVLSEEGPAHARKFTIGVYVNDSLIGEGSGKSKQAAEEAAAEAALTKINL